MSGSRFTVTNQDCPICGKKEGACMGNTVWGHRVMCCSDECGHAVAEIIEKNTSSQEFKEAVKQKNRYTVLVEDLRYSGIPEANHPSTGFPLFDTLP